MLNSVPAGRRLARRSVLNQAVATLLVSLASLVFGVGAALGALLGGAAMTLGNGLAGLSAFSGGVTGAGSAFGRLLLGIAAKWVLVVVVLFAAIGLWKLPALSVLAGMASAVLAMLITAKVWLQRV